MWNPSQSCRASPAMLDHTLFPATHQKWTHPALTAARQGGTWFTCPGRMEGSVDLGSWLHTDMVYLFADSHPSK